MDFVCNMCGKRKTGNNIMLDGEFLCSDCNKKWQRVFHWTSKWQTRVFDERDFSFKSIPGTLFLDRKGAGNWSMWFSYVSKTTFLPDVGMGSTKSRAIMHAQKHLRRFLLNAF